MPPLPYGRPSSSPSYVFANAAASSSSHPPVTRLPTNTHRPKPSQSSRHLRPDVFKPKLPKDPFAVIARPPVQVSSEAVFTLAAAGPAKNVILALGAPSQDHLSPILRSEVFAASLLIVASHDPPVIPSYASPAVRVLRLSTPLDLEKAGAIRLVNVLEWAERVARSWRKDGGVGVHYIDEHDTGALAPPAIFRSRSNSSSSVASAKSQTPPPTASPFALDNVQAASSASNLLSSRTLKKRNSRPLPKADPCQRPFDTLLHCIGPDVPDKQVLKQSILVTTVSRPFLIAASLPMPPTPTSLPSRRSFLRSSVYSGSGIPSSSRDSLSASFRIPLGKSHIIHVLSANARASPQVLSSIETFMLSNSPQGSDCGSRRAPPASIAPARPFILNARIFADVLPIPSLLGISAELSVADALIGCCADVTPPDLRPRAWIQKITDLNVTSPASGGAADIPHASASARVRDRVTDGVVRGAGGLPTPPDSEEETAASEVTDGERRRATLGKRVTVGEPLAPPPSAKGPALRLSSSAPPTLNGPHSATLSHTGHGTLSLPESSLAQGRRGRRSRWMFWRKSE